MSEIANQQVLAELLEVVDTPDPQRVDNAPGRKTQEQHDEIIELGDTFDFDGFQVVRREFFAHTFEPAVTFNNYKFYVNVPARLVNEMRLPGVAHPKGAVSQSRLPANCSS